MVTIPAGEFQMGCHPEHNAGYACPPDELPLHTVFLDAYRIDRFEVSNEKYARCVTAGACKAPGEDPHGRTPPLNDPAFASYPVTILSWNQASAYCLWAGKRLPREAEWEKAARGTDIRAFPWGDSIPDCKIANFAYFDGTSYVQCQESVRPGGSYPEGASPYGLLEMAVNAWEWVDDWFQSGYYRGSPLRNPPGPAE